MEMVRIQTKKPQLANGHFWGEGKVFEVEPNLGNYLIGMGDAIKVGKDVELSPVPDAGEKPLIVSEHLKRVAEEAALKAALGNTAQNSMEKTVADAIQMGVQKTLAAMGLTPEMVAQMAAKQKADKEAELAAIEAAERAEAEKSKKK